MSMSSDELFDCLRTAPEFADTRAVINSEFDQFYAAIGGEEIMQRAYDIHGKFYEGEDVTDAEANFLIDFLDNLPENTPFSVRMWAVFASRYV